MVGNNENIGRLQVHKGLDNYFGVFQPLFFALLFLGDFLDGLPAGDGEISRGHDLVIEILEFLQTSGIEYPDHLEMFAKDPDFGPADIGEVYIQVAGRDHVVGQDAHLVILRLEPSPCDQRPTQASDLALLRRQPQHPQGIVGVLPVLHLDVRLGLVAVPAARRHGRNRVEITARVLEHGFFLGIPGFAADQQPLVEPLVVPLDLIEAQGGPDGGERKHRKGQKQQRDEGQNGPCLAALHVGDAEHERGHRSAGTAHIGIMDHRHLGSQLPHLLVEPARDDPHHQAREAQDYKGQQDHKRVGQLESRMHLRENDPDHEEDSGEPQDLVLDGRRRDDETFGEIGTGDDQRHEEDDAPDDVVLGVLHIRVSPRFQADRRARVPDKFAPALLLEGNLGHVEHNLGAVVQVVHPVVFNAKNSEFPDARLVQGPHVLGGQERGVRKGSLGRNREAFTFGLLLVGHTRGIQQQIAEAEDAGAKAHLDVHGRQTHAREEDPGRLIQGRGPFAQRVPVLHRRTVALVEHAHRGKLGQVARIDDIVEVIGHTGEQDHHPLLVAPVHGNLHGKGLVALHPAVRGIGNLARARIQVIAFDLQRVDPDPVDVEGTGLIHHFEVLAPHPLVGLLLAVAHRGNRTGARQVRHDTAPGKDHGAAAQ